jgi:hypothetical protein
MKLNYFLLVGLVSCSSVAFAQNPVPNFSFEDWTNSPLLGDHPTYWFGIVEKSTDAHTGNFAVHGSVKDSGDQMSIMSAVFDNQSLQTYPGFTLPFRPIRFQGWYKLTSVQNDRLSFEVHIYSKGELVGGWLIEDSVTTLGWTHFDEPIFYASPNEPDTAVIFVFFDNSKGSYTTHVGSSFTVDDIMLTGETSIVSSSTSRTVLSQNYPNPFRTNTRVIYALAVPSSVTLELFNELGERVWQQFQPTQVVGEHEIEIDCKGLTAGLYRYCLTTNSGFSASKFLQILP